MILILLFSQPPWVIASMAAVLLEKLDEAIAGPRYREFFGLLYFQPIEKSLRQPLSEIASLSVLSLLCHGQ